MVKEFIPDKTGDKNSALVLKLSDVNEVVGVEKLA